MVRQVPAQRGRMHPAAFGVEQPAGGQADAGDTFRLDLVQLAQQRGREGVGQFALALGFGVIEAQLQHAAIGPFLALAQPLDQPPRMAEAADDEPRERRVVGGQLEVQHALRVARGLFGKARVALDQRHLPTPRGEAGGAGATGHAAADHQRFAHRLRPGRSGVPGFAGRCRVTDEVALGHLPFLAEAQGAADLEASSAEPAPHEAGAGEGGQGRARPGQAGELGVERVIPHLRVLRRGEAVEEPGVDACVELRQGLEHVAHQQGQHHAAAGEDQALEAGVDRHILLQQLFGQRRQLRPEGECAAQVVRRHRVLLGGDEVQSRIARRAFLEQLPGAEEVQPGAEAGFADAQAPAGG